MNAIQFQYLAALYLHNGVMTAGTLLDYTSSSATSAEEYVKQDLAILIATGLIESEYTGTDWQSCQLSLTELGVKIAEASASIRMDRMIRDFRKLLTPTKNSCVAAAF